MLWRLHTYPITERGKQTEINTIKNILQNNEYNTNLYCGNEVKTRK
jgi:hypothetical protein